MFTYILAPALCPVCDKVLPNRKEMLCDECRTKAPYTHTSDKVANPVVRMLWKELHITHACSFLYYNKDRRYRKLVYNFKYRRMWYAAYRCGRWFGKELKASPLYADIDVVVPVPMHIFKRVEREYNQTEFLAKGIAKELGVEYDHRALRRIRHTPSQTEVSAESRSTNVRGAFRLKHPELLEGKHILLVDDVMTTGSTVIACGKEILDNTLDTRLSIATFAYAGNDEETKPKKKE